MQRQYVLGDAEATVAMGQQLAQASQGPLVIHLRGDLGAGKTTLSRGVITGFGHNGKVKSPTYTLVEPYHLPSRTVYHFDLYRLADPEELEFMGIRDYFADNTLCLVEWPERGGDLLKAADLAIELRYHNEQRIITITALTDAGQQVVHQLDVQQSLFSALGITACTESAK